MNILEMIETPPVSQTIEEMTTGVEPVVDEQIEGVELVQPQHPRWWGWLTEEPVFVPYDAATAVPKRVRTRAKLATLWKETHGRCVYCDRRLGLLCRPGHQASWAFTVDHLVPRAHGGRSDLGNLVPACHHCNNTRSAKVPAALHAHPKHREYVDAKEAILYNR